MTVRSYMTPWHVWVDPHELPPMQYLTPTPSTSNRKNLEANQRITLILTITHSGVKHRKPWCGKTWYSSYIFGNLWSNFSINLHFYVVLPSSYLITALFPNFSFLRNSFQEKYSIKMQTWPYVLPSRIEHVRINQAHLLIFLFLIPCKELRRISRAERSMGTYEGN